MVPLFGHFWSKSLGLLFTLAPDHSHISLAFLLSLWTSIALYIHHPSQIAHHFLLGLLQLTSSWISMYTGLVYSARVNSGILTILCSHPYFRATLVHHFIDFLSFDFGGHMYEARHDLAPDSLRLTLCHVASAFS